MKIDFLRLVNKAKRLGLPIYRAGLPIYRTYPFLIDLIYSKRDKEINDWYGKKKIFFIVSTGRTGTMWLSNLLNQIDGYLVSHEPVFMEVIAYRAACENHKFNIPYIRFRKREIYKRCRSLPELNGYGEVNGNLRRHIVAISKIVPDATIIHLVRDGRDVVRSIMCRKALTAKHPVCDETFIVPTVELIDEEWFNLSRFEKICWVWREENVYMRKNTSFRARFEDITSSYSLFKKQILEPLGLELNEDVWHSSSKNPTNMTKNYTIGPWEDWTTEQREQFIRICGKEMKEYGYKTEE